MRAVIVTLEEPFYLPWVIASLCKKMPGPPVAVITLPPTFPSDTFLASLRKYLAMFGPVECGRRALQMISCAAADRAGAVLGRESRHSVRGVAAGFGVPCMKTNDVNSAGTINRLRESAPDVIVNVSGNQIFRKELLALPAVACINVHAGPLPRYRGLFPLYWVLANGEADTAVTAHYMSEAVDRGGILAQRPIPIEPGETLASLCRKAQAVTADVVVEALRNAMTRGFVPLPNDPGKGSYYSFPGKEQRLALMRRGVRFR